MSDSLRPTPRFRLRIPNIILNTCFFYKHSRLKLEKGQTNESKILRLNFCYLKIILILHPCCHPKVIGHTLKNKQKNKCVFIHDITWLIIMKTKMKLKNRSHRHGINRPRSRNGHKYAKYEKYLKMIMSKCTK